MIFLTDSSNSKLGKIIAEAVEEYNQFRAPEVIAKLLSITKDLIEIRFSGTFCLTCGFYDYFDDFKFILEDLGVKQR